MKKRKLTASEISARINASIPAAEAVLGPNFDIYQAAFIGGMFVRGKGAFVPEKDTVSYSKIERCIKRIEKRYPKDVFEEMLEAGIIDNFYSECCISCIEYDKCHSVPYK